MSSIEFDHPYRFTTVWKFSNWAENLPDDVDFLDYWYCLFLSATKAKIESSPLRNINAFHWTRWKNDFETYVDGYSRIPGNGFSGAERCWFGMYMQALVCSLQTPSRIIAEHYGKDRFRDVMNMFPKWHCNGLNYFVGSFATRYGLPPGVDDWGRIQEG